MLVARSFQSLGALTEKALLPITKELGRREKKSEEAEKRRRFGQKSVMESDKYAEEGRLG